MANCQGDGSCYKYCECECYDAETDEDYEVCACGHHSHNVMVGGFSYIRGCLGLSFYRYNHGILF